VADVACLFAGGCSLELWQSLEGKVAGVCIMHVVSSWFTISLILRLTAILCLSSACSLFFCISRSRLGRDGRPVVSSHTSIMSCTCLDSWLMVSRLIKKGASSVDDVKYAGRSFMLKSNSSLLNWIDRRAPNGCERGGLGGGVQSWLGDLNAKDFNWSWVTGDRSLPIL